jgi:ubiquinone/menaquinone biosynthesis C-methylase UbiE
MAAGYGVLPPIYDRWQKSYGKDFSELVLPRLLSSIRRHRISGDTLVDVACGTGSLALFMARRGWKVSGVDASQGMIDAATRKFRDARLPAQLIVSDMRYFILPCQVALATSFFDGLNHLLEEEELREAFRAVYRSLTKGGWFVFDMNNEHCFSTLWTKAERVELPEFTLELDSSYDRSRKLGTCVARLDMRDGAGEQTETVTERWYPTETVKEMLTEAGFEVQETEDFNFTLNPLVGNLKTWWVASKKG